MDKIGYRNWGASIAPVAVLIFCFLAAIAAQPGFLSIDCGGKTNYTDENGIAWVTDANYVDMGQTANMWNATSLYDYYFSSLRFFPKPLNKSCYHLPVVPDVPYLLRLWFFLGNFSEFLPGPSFAFSIETMGTLSMTNVSVFYGEQLSYERILVSSGKVLYICLIRGWESGDYDPFISAIELRRLQNGMYGQAKPGTILHNQQRTDVGGGQDSLMVRYPQDNFDRIWTTSIYGPLSPNIFTAGFVSTQQPISVDNAGNLPPTFVMQTAWFFNSSKPTQFSLGPFAPGRPKVLLVMYFAEIQELDKMSESRFFYVTVNGKNRSVTLARDYSALELSFLFNQTYVSESAVFEFALVKATNSTLPPIINAFEYYLQYDTEPATYMPDSEALDAIKTMFHITTWISDPCFVIAWDGIRCDNSATTPRVYEIDLSGRNLSGLVPPQIGQLSALLNVALDHNQLMGSLPDLSNLTILERLHLQNNNLSGTVPAWLSELKNLKELFLENNNFSGEIPVQLLNKSSLILRYSGNPYLSIPDWVGRHKPPNLLREHLVLGTILSGSVLIIGLSLIAGIVLYRKNKECVITQSNGVENVVGVNSNECVELTTMVPNSAKSYAFTLDQVTAATQKFSGNIGKGGFGSVFLGKLPEGKNIAVKVLSLFSTHGVNQFLNEIDVLSRVYHENLVSLLGYCNETKELMIIYEHMSGGSLRDRLYGPRSSELNWKTRIKIALDAAQGLEYMHIACTPKIIHRDVKTANILLDSNLKGKLGDFGLSKIWIDGEASHVTTMVKGTAGYLDPEYFSTERLTEKSDVYSFGVVLLELICGRQPINAKLSLEKLNIIRWVTPFVEMDAIPGKIEEIVDKRLNGNYDIRSITCVAKVAIRCVKTEPFYRPSIVEVVAELMEALKLEENYISISNGFPQVDLGGV